MRSLLIFSVTIAGTALILTGGVSRAGCGGEGGGKKEGGGERREGQRGRDGRSGAGVGFNADLGGVGRRTREPDPFAASGGSSNSHPAKREHPKKKGKPSTTSNPFADVKLTGKEAKNVAASEGSSAAKSPNE
jgi:hypothetical protein